MRKRIWSENYLSTPLSPTMFFVTRKLQMMEGLDRRSQRLHHDGRLRAEVPKIVQSTPGAIGFVDVRSIDGTINVVRVNGKLPMESGYLPH